MRESPGSTIRELSDTLMISLSHSRRVIQRMMRDGEVSCDGEGAHRRFYLNMAEDTITVNDD